jgi:hypothetical protein
MERTMTANNCVSVRRHLPPPQLQHLLAQCCRYASFVYTLYVLQTAPLHLCRIGASAPMAPCGCL